MGTRVDTCSTILMVVFGSMTSYAMTSLTYESKSFIDSNGRRLCAVDKPSTVVSTKKSPVWCGVQCTTMNCPYYQFKANSSKCEFFDNIPGNFMVYDQCSAYIASPGTTGTGVLSSFVLALLNRSGIRGPPSLSVNSWIVIHNKVPLGSSSTSFRQLWAAYRNGFGDLTMTSNYWIGNEVIYGLVSTGNYQLRVEVTFNDASSMSVIYSSFSIGSESTQYTLSVSGYQGVSNGNALMQTYNDVGFVSNGMKFSTADRDNDRISTSNCADDFKGGWWFNVCSQSVQTMDMNCNWVRINEVISSRMVIKQI